MKETTKPKNTKQSHLLKRDLAENIAVLPLPTPPAGARGEGCGFTEDKFETRNSKTEIQETSNVEHRTPNLEFRKVGVDFGARVAADVDLKFPEFPGIAARRDEPLSLSQETILTLTTDYRLPNV
jgi:hypothetical protein